MAVAADEGGRGEARADILLLLPLPPPPPPPSDVPLRRRGVFEELSDTSMFAI